MCFTYDQRLELSSADETCLFFQLKFIKLRPTRAARKKKKQAIQVFYKLTSRSTLLLIVGLQFKKLLNLLISGSRYAVMQALENMKIFARLYSTVIIE